MSLAVTRSAPRGAGVSVHDAPTVAFLRAGAVVTGGLGVLGAVAVGLLRGPTAGVSLAIGVCVPVLVVTLGVLAVSLVTRAAPGYSLVAAGAAFLFTVMTVPTMAYAAARVPWVERPLVGWGIAGAVLIWQVAAAHGWLRARHAVLGGDA